MTKTNFLNDIGVVNFSISKYADDYLVLHQSNEIEFLNLAGGIPEPTNEKILFLLDLSFEQNSVSFFIDSSIFLAERELFWREKSIYNKHLKVFDTGRNIGTFILINQIIQARKLKFQYLFVSAARSMDFNGYYSWARLGYSINSPDDEEQFQDLLHEHGRTERSLRELMQTTEGRLFWKKNGFWWEGIFDISDGSENIKNLNAYLAQAGIKCLL